MALTQMVVNAFLFLFFTIIKKSFAHFFFLIIVNT